MPNCMNCGKFVLIPKYGLCKSCYPGIAREIITLKNQYDSHMKRADLTVDPLQKKYHLQRMIELARRMKEIFERSQFGDAAEAQRAIDNCLKDIDEIDKQFIIGKIDKYLEKAKLAKTKSSKINNANNAIVEAQAWLSKHPGDKDFMDRINLAQDIVRKAEFEDVYEKAKKEEFKGNIKKAIGLYKEALYILKTDDLPDELQSNIISEVENKIAALEGELKNG